MAGSLIGAISSPGLKQAYENAPGVVISGAVCLVVWAILLVIGKIKKKKAYEENDAEGQVQQLDNSPLRDTVFKEPFEVLPAYCEDCGKYEFYNPAIIRKNKRLVYLASKDTQE